MTGSGCLLTEQARKLLMGLMPPIIMIVLNVAMFGVALPIIRDEFAISADMTAWLVTAYTLPFVNMMPLYGRLGDGLGKRRLFIIGSLTFLVGTVITLWTETLGGLMLGRVVQGMGAGCVNPLSIAIISERFPPQERGQALGTWNSVGPFGAVVGPLLGGFLVDHLGWRTVFVPVLIFGLGAVWAIKSMVPPGQRTFVQPGFVRLFDWWGVLFLAAGTISLLFYTSSRPITGVDALRDWRLLAATLLFFGLFIFREKYRVNPFINLQIWQTPGFSRASLGASIRMFTMSSMFFLAPLYLADVHQMKATPIGTMLTVHAAALMVVMRLGGQLADRWGSRYPVMIGATLQTVTLIYFAMLPGSAGMGWIAVGLFVHGFGAGGYLAALHRTAMAAVSSEQMGMAAGVYSMVRFLGTAVGTTLVGVILQYGLERWTVLQAYQLVYWFIAIMALLAVVVGWGIREDYSTVSQPSSKPRSVSVSGKSVSD